MNLIVEKEDFFKKLLRVQYVHEKKTTLDITTCVLLTASGKEIEMVATDLETNFRDYCQAEILEEGSTAVNSKRLMEIVRGLTSETISLKTLRDENCLLIEGGRSVFRLPLRAPEDFPHTPFFDEEELIQLDAPVFKKMLDKVLFSVPTRKAQANIAGLIMKENILNDEENNGNSRKTLEVFSVDIHRMVRIERDFDYNGTLNLFEGIVLPKRGAQELSNILEGAEVFQIAALENFLAIKQSSSSLTIRLLNYQIPRIDVKMLTSAPYSFQTERDKLLEILKRISVMTSEDYRHVMVKILESQIRFSINNPGIGTAEEDLETNYDGPEMNFVFNVRFLIEAVSNIESQVINIGVIREKAPFIFTGEDDEGYISVLMPLILIGEDEEDTGKDEL